VNKLVKGDLIDKTAQPEDRRRVLLRVTNSGRARLDELLETQRPVNDAIFAGLTSAQFHACVEIIASLFSGTNEALALQHLLAEQRRR
jgi:MarR family transcriptional regulator, organic hydroperoxide resistance regulator